MSYTKLNGTQAELSHHGVDQCLVTLVLWGVGQLHVEGLQDLVKSADGIANEAANIEV